MLVFFNSIDPINCVIVGLLDFTLHYHIDWIKMNYGNRNIHSKQFWRDLGLDQLAHQLCYILYVVYFQENYMFNPVAKHCFKYNRPTVEKNKKVDYNRKHKHKKPYE